MTKDVLISVKGLQFMGDEQAEPIEVVAAGEYYYRNGSHYLRYHESMEGFSESTINTIKINNRGMEVRKKGITNVHMVFEKEKKNLTFYQTPYGGMEMGIAATKIDCDQGEDHINIHVDYSLEMNDEHIADCFLQVNVRPRQGRELHLI